VGNEQVWTPQEEMIARIISWGIIISIAIMIVGGIWTVLEFIINFSEPSSQFALIDWFIGLEWTFKILIIGGLIIGIFIGVIAFSLFIRKGQKFLLNLLFKIKEEEGED